MGRRRIVFVLIFILIALSASCIKITEIENEDKLIITSMFPRKEFVLEGNMFVDEASIQYETGKQSYYIEKKISGSFVNPNSREYLVIVRRPEKEPTHAEGYYQAYLAVFKESDNRIISGTHLFSADEGYISLFSSKDLDYIFFAGGTTYYGWTTWYGGLWKVGLEWKKVWPEEGIYWEDLYPKVSNDGLTIFERKILPHTSEKVPPDYVWQYSYSLDWNPEKACFE